MKATFEAKNTYAGRRLLVSLRLQRLFFATCLLIPLLLIDAVSEVKAKKHTSTASNKTTTARTSSKTSVKATHHGKTHEAVTAATTGRHHHTLAATENHSHKGLSRTETKTVKTVHVVRDRHGRIIRRETVFTAVKETSVPKHHEALQKEEKVVTAKEKVEPQSPPENSELPSEYHDFQKAYALYDEGTNARLSGNYSEAITNISRALSMVPSNSHGGPSVLVLNMEYDLAQAAEKSGDFPLAARYYARALSDRPNFPEASVRLSRVLAQNGKFDEAMRAARDGVSRSPNDARVHAILAILLNKNGQTAEALIENKKAQMLLNSGSNRSYVQPGPGSAPSFKTSTQNAMPENSVAPVSSTGVDDDASAANKSNSKNSSSEDEGFMP